MKKGSKIANHAAKKPENCLIQNDWEKIKKNTDKSGNNPEKYAAT